MYKHDVNSTRHSLGFPCAKTFFLNLGKFGEILLKINLNNNLNEFISTHLYNKSEKLAFKKMHCLFTFQPSICLHFNLLFVYISTFCFFTFQPAVCLHFSLLFFYISTCCLFTFQPAVCLHFNLLFVNHFHLIFVYIST